MEYSILLDDDTDRLILKDRNAWRNAVAKSYIGGSALVSKEGLHANFDTGATLLFNDMPTSYFVRSYNHADHTNAGTSVQLYGTAEIDFELGLTIDGVDSISHIIARPMIGIVYESPKLSDAPHNITFNNFLPVLDFIVVKTTNAALIRGERLIVDDEPTDRHIGGPSKSALKVVYNEYWATDDNPLFGDIKRTPFGTTYRIAGTVQATATFNFYGVSVSVYGIFSLSNDGIYSVPSVLFTLDGTTEVSDLAPPGLQSNETNANFLWYTRSFLSPSNHTLVIHFNGSNDASAAPFTLDYLLTSPDLNLSPPSSSISGSSVSTTTGSSATAGPSTTGSSSGTASMSSQRNVLIGSIVGVIGGMLLLAGLVFLLRKKLFPRLFSAPAPKRMTIEPERSEEFPPSGLVPALASVVEPFSDDYEDLSSSAPSSSGTRTEASSGPSGAGSSRVRLIVQGGSGDMVQIPPREKSPLSKGSHTPSASVSTIPPSDQGRATIAEGANERAQRIQGLVEELQHEIQASGIVVTAATDDALSPPPYEPSIRRGLVP
ncbi:hypothetical protein DXG01_005175 [Tephrocybe rancida]|nr:hypothetical protein DXG01_005175 [Tephrocybe rancida]